MANERLNSTIPQYFFQLTGVIPFLGKVVSPLLLVFGIFGNVMTIIVMRGLRGGQTIACMSVYFTALAVSDLLLLFVGMAKHWAELQTIHDVACKILSFVGYVFGQTSAWILVAMTSQRVISVVWPLNIHLRGSRGRTLSIVTLIFLASLLYNSAVLKYFSVYSTDGAKWCAIEQHESTFVYINFIFWSDLFMMSVVPFASLCFNNAILIWKVIQSSRRTRNMTDSQHANSRAKLSSLSITLVVTTTAFLVLTLPFSAFGIVYKFTGVKISEETHWLVYGQCTELLWYCNCTVNFYLYCLSGTKFRNEAKEKLMICLPKCFWVRH